MRRVNRQARRTGRHATSPGPHAVGTGGLRCTAAATRRPAGSHHAPAPVDDPVLAVQQLFRRTDTRVLDLLDVLLANQMLGMVGVAPLDVRATGTDRTTVFADDEQVAVLRAICWDTRPQLMELWLLQLAPRLVSEVLALVGEVWTAEAELSVELALSLRTDDVADLADQLFDGPVCLDSARSAAEIIAADVTDPVLVHFL